MSQEQSAERQVDVRESADPLAEAVGINFEGVPIYPESATA